MDYLDMPTLLQLANTSDNYLDLNTILQLGQVSEYDNNILYELDEVIELIKTYYDNDEELVTVEDVFWFAVGCDNLQILDWISSSYPQYRYRATDGKVVYTSVTYAL